MSKNSRRAEAGLLQQCTASPAAHSCLPQELLQHIAASAVGVKLSSCLAQFS